ncbi:MAG: hypothetical protein FJ217_13685 [Ignavibacteria bacterium]|nr:hypothetical protein [Ignavibacteria bacterium]
MSEPTPNTKQKADSLHDAYEEFVAKAEEQHPGITELLSLYGELQKGLEQSQAYLRLFDTTYTSSASNSTR